MKNNLILIVSLLVVGFFAYSYLNKTDVSTSYLAQDVSTTDSSEARYIYNLSQKIKPLELKDDIFRNDVFNALRDNTVDFPQQTSGRINPFAPLGADGSTQGPSTSSPVNIRY